MTCNSEQFRNIDSEMLVNVKQRMERYLRTSGVAPSRFGRDAVGDPRLVADIRKGRELRASTALRVQAYLDAVEGLSQK